VGEKGKKEKIRAKALIVFHEAGGNLYGFPLEQDGLARLQLETTARSSGTVTDFLRALGNFGPNREMAAVDLKDTKWPEVAGKTYQAIFGDAHLDLAKTTSPS